MTLDDYLGGYYRAAALSHGPAEQVVAALRKALTFDPALAAEARARLVAIEKIDEGRCYITKQHRDCLSAALSAP